MTTPAAQLVEVRAAYDQLAHSVEVLGCALESADRLTARYAAAQITELSDKIEAALLALDYHARALAARAIVTIDSL